MTQGDRIIERSNEGFTFRFYESEKGTRYTHYDCERRLKAAANGLYRWFSRTLKTRTTSGDAEQDKYDLQRLRWIAAEVAEYVAVIQRELDRLEGVDRTSERVKALREVTGRTPEETALFLAKAEQIEARTAA